MGYSQPSHHWSKESRLKAILLLASMPLFKLLGNVMTNYLCKISKYLPLCSTEKYTEGEIQALDWAS